MAETILFKDEIPVAGKLPKDTGRMRREFEQEIHPDLRTLLLGFARYSREKGLVPPLITDLVRTKAEQIAIYRGYFGKLLDSQKPGPKFGLIDLEGDGTWRPLRAEEKEDLSWLNQQIAAAIEAENKRLGVCLGPSDCELLITALLPKLADGKATWHRWKCAADLRTTGGGAPRYSGGQLQTVQEYFAPRCKKPQWEWVIHDVTAPHLHVGRRDFGWRKDPVIIPDPPPAA